MLAEFGKPYTLRPGALEAVRATEDARRSLPAQNAQWRPGSVMRRKWHHGRHPRRRPSPSNVKQPPSR
jgi:hypothetical protein